MAGWEKFATSTMNTISQHNTSNPHGMVDEDFASIYLSKSTNNLYTPSDMAEISSALSPNVSKQFSTGRNMLQV